MDGNDSDCLTYKIVTNLPEKLATNVVLSEVTPLGRD